MSWTLADYVAMGRGLRAALRLAIRLGIPLAVIGFVIVQITS